MQGKERAPHPKQRKQRRKATVQGAQGCQPPRGITQPKSPITQPSGHRASLLPLVDIGSRKFEELCRDILRRAFPHVVQTSLKRESGVEQYGADAEGFDSDHEPSVVISAKCYRVIEAWHFRPWLQDFLSHLDGHWKGKAVKHFVLAVTHECNDDHMNQAARELVMELRDRGIKFYLWNSHLITDLLSEDPRLVDRYFGRYWVEAISAEVPAVHPTVETSAPLAARSLLHGAGSLAQQIVSQVASAFVGPINLAMAGRLEDALESLRAGRGGSLRGWLEDGREPTVWDTLHAETRAKALRAAAMLHLQDGDLAKAGELLDEADGLAPPPDSSARALLVRARGSPEDALDLLADPRTMRERELLASLLIEVGQTREALAMLGEVAPQLITTEVLRLRAICEFLSGFREKSLNTALTAHSRSPAHAIPLLTLGIIRLFSAIADGVQPQFAGMPNPVLGALVKNTRAARDHLAQAAASFQRLLLTVDQPLKAEIEIWNLAALLLHPDRRDEARTFSRLLLRREDLEPVAVAWCLQFGIGMHDGKIRKRLGDAIRHGHGTPSHVVVLALMSARLADSSKGLAVIGRFAYLFPEADHFFKAWRAQFGELSCAPEETYSAAVHHSMRSEDNAPLLAFLTSPRANVENIISGAEFLAWRGAFTDLDELRIRLLKVGTARAMELAATAALRSGKPHDCIAILEGGAETFGDRLPIRLIHLRIRANEDLGAHRPVIADLLALLNDRDDPQIRNRLMDAYLRIGALHEFQAEAERALDEGRLDQRHAIQVAYALRTHAPETARRALRRAADESITPQIAGAMLSLSAELGLSDIQDRMIRLITVESPEAAGVIRFDSVEDVLAFVERQAREYREGFAQWLQGRALAAMAMRSDLKAYGCLFLGSPRDRRNNIGDVFPMLLLAGARRDPPPAITGDLPVLRIDLSALLLAARLELLPAVETLFSVQIPESVPESLMRMEAEFKPANADVVAATRAVLASESAVQIAEEIPQEAVRLESAEEAFTLQGAVLRALLEHAFHGGHLGRDQVDEAARELGLGEISTRPEWSAQATVLTPYALARLAQARVLEQVARAVPTLLARGDAERLERNMDAALREQQLRDRIVSLRADVADRLERGAWRTVPRTTSEKDGPRLEHLPSHLRSLVEILSAQEHGPQLFWAEDRLMSQQRLKDAVYLPELLDLLFQRDVITERKRMSAREELRAAGYSFLPIEIDEILREIERAPILDDELVESPGLGRFRRWFAEELQRIEHLDMTPRFDSKGVIVGEARRLLDLGALARDLLLRLWSNPNAKLREKIARSSWTWTCLRFVQTLPAPALAVPEALRRYVAMNVAHILDLPLFAELGSDPMTRADQREFVGWFVRTVLDPLSEADPRFGEAVADILSSMMIRLLEPAGDLDEAMKSSLTTSLQVAVQGFLDLLPDAWAGHVAAKYDLHTKLQHRPAVVLIFGEESEITVSDFADAFGRGLGIATDALPGIVPVRLLRGEAGEIEVGPKADPVPRVTLRVKERQMSVPRLTLALAHPDLGTRERALAGLPRLVDPEGSIRPKHLSAIASEPDVEARFSALDNLFAGDFQRALLQVRSRVDAGQPIRMSDLRLPAPSTLTAFLRLDRVPEEISDGLTFAITALRTEFDVGRVAERLASLPLAAPEDLLREYGETLRHGPTGASVPNAQSPLLSVFRAVALAAADQVESGMLGGAVQAVVSAVELQGDLFAALVRHGARQALRRADWDALPDQIMVPLIWMYADQMTRMLPLSKVEPTRLAQWINTATRFHLRDIERQAKLPDWARHLTAEFGAHHLAAALASLLIGRGITGRVAPEHVQQIKATTGHEGTTGWFPVLDIVRPPPAAPAAFWLASDPIALMVQDGWIERESLFAVREHSGLAARLMNESVDPAQRHIIPALLSIVDIQQVDPDAVGRIRDVLERSDGEAVLEPEEAGFQRILSVRASVLARQNDSDSFCRELRRQAARCAAIWPHVRLNFELGGDGAPALAILANAGFAHAAALPRSRAERMTAFSQGMLSIADGWPNALRAVIGILDGVVIQLDVETASVVWPVLIDLRSRA